MDARAAEGAFWWPVVAPHVVRPAPRPLRGPTVALDAGWRSAVAARRVRLAADPAGVRVRDPADPDDAGLLAALAAAAAVVQRDAPGALELVAGGADGDGWQAAADRVVLAQPADLVVLRRTPPGLTAELLCVALPSGWPPRLRAGATLARLHAPVADGDRLRAASGALAEALLTKGPFELGVWGVQRDGELAHDPSVPGGLPAPSPDGGWWVRTERQTTTPLPALGRALFWIRPTVTPVAALTPERRAGLAAAVRSLSPAGLDYKGLGGGLDAALLAALAA